MNYRRWRWAGLLAAALAGAFLGDSSARAWRAGPGSGQEPLFQISPPAGEAANDAEARRPVRGRIDFGRISRRFSNATLVLTLNRSAIPNSTTPSGMVAELKHFGVSWAPGQDPIFPFTLGDFGPAPGAIYSLQCLLDIDGSGEKNVGDYWADREVRVLSPQSPASATIQDFMPVVEAP